MPTLGHRHFYKVKVQGCFGDTLIFIVQGTFSKEKGKQHGSQLLKGVNQQMDGINTLSFWHAAELTQLDSTCLPCQGKKPQEPHELYGSLLIDCLGANM